MTDWVEFTRAGDEIRTHGVMWSGKITVVLKMTKGHEVWKKGPGHVWSGQGAPWASVPAAYWIVEVRGGTEFKIVEEREPGAKWRACRKEMIERVLDMHQTDLALKAFKEEGV